MTRRKNWKLREVRPQGGRPWRGGEKRSKLQKYIRNIDQKAKKLQRTIKKLEAKQVDDNNKINSYGSDDLIADDTAGPNRDHPALTRQVIGKGESKCGGNKQEWTGWEGGKTMIFSEGTKFTVTGRKKIATVRSVKIKVANSSVTDKIWMELDSHTNTCVLVKECLKVYD